MGEEPRIVTERRGSLLFAGINRPDKRNALDEAMADELTAVLDAAKRAGPCVLILHSTTPGTFVSGADIAELIERRADDAFRAINAGLFERLEAHRWPTIAAIDGYALGGGCELAMACDLRVASTRSKFGQPETGLGILAGAGANWRLAQLVGLGSARRLLYTGEIIDSAAAAGIGLVDQVVEPDEVLSAATALGEQMARQSWRALELTKLSLRLHRPATTTFDLAAQALCFDSSDKAERMGAFLAKRQAKEAPG